MKIDIGHPSILWQLLPKTEKLKGSCFAEEFAFLQTKFKWKAVHLFIRLPNWLIYKKQRLDNLDSIAASVFVLFELSLTNTQQIQITIWRWGQITSWLWASVQLDDCSLHLIFAEWNENPEKRDPRISLKIWKQTLEVFLPWWHWGSPWWRGCEPRGREAACVDQHGAPATSAAITLPLHCVSKLLKFDLWWVIIGGILLGPANPQTHNPHLNLQYIKNKKLAIHKEERTCNT